MTPPIVFLDACVLFPPLVRTILTGAAAARLFVPRWSPRVLDEWIIATARRQGADGETAARAARTDMDRDFPSASVAPDPHLEAQLALPDPADAHVAAAAHGADLLVTFNLRDFPRRTMAGLGVEARHPDSFLWELASTAPGQMDQVLRAALAANTIPWPDRRRALKRARLPRLGKVVGSD